MQMGGLAIRMRVHFLIFFSKMCYADEYHWLQSEVANTGTRIGTCVVANLETRNDGVHSTHDSSC
jgi:hypothetical protein